MFLKSKGNWPDLTPDENPLAQQWKILYKTPEMRKKILITVILSLLTSGCATYEGPNGRTQYGDPEMCNHRDPSACLLMISAVVFGCAVLIANAEH
jgi:hypothetical protein